VEAPTLLFFVTEDWYFCSHRLSLAKAARDSGWHVVVATRVQEHAPPILAEGLTLAPLRLRRGNLRPLRELAALVEILKVYRKYRPRVAHHVAVKPIIYGTLAALATGTPRVINAIAGLGSLFTGPQGGIQPLRFIVRAAYRLVLSQDRVSVVVQNRFDADVVRALGVPAQRITLIAGSGVDLSHFRATEEPPAPIVVCMVSRMLRDKGVRELVQAARLLAGRIPELRIKLVGLPDPDNPTSLTEDVLQSWRREGLVEWVRSAKDVALTWERSHIAVLPSYREGLPKALVEAAACARPAIATDVPGCSDVVVDGETGLLVPARDPEALAHAIAQLATDAGLRRRMGLAARLRAERFFGDRVVIAQTMALYGPSG